jgi:hypothetical protein
LAFSPEYMQMQLPNVSALRYIQASRDDCSGGGMGMGTRWTAASVVGVYGEIKYLPEVEAAQRGAASQAVGDASPCDGVELVPTEWKQAPGQFAQQSRGNGQEGSQ